MFTESVIVFVCIRLIVECDMVVFVVVGAALIPVVYSYFAYRGLEGFGPDPEINVDADLEP